MPRRSARLRASKGSRPTPERSSFGSVPTVTVLTAAPLGPSKSQRQKHEGFENIQVLILVWKLLKRTARRNKKRVATRGHDCSQKFGSWFEGLRRSGMRRNAGRWTRRLGLAAMVGAVGWA